MKGRKKKGPWDDLSDDFKENMAGATDERINQEIRDKSLYGVRLEELKKEDQDLATKHQTYRDAGAVYRDGKKEVNLSISFLREILKARGRSLPGDGQEPGPQE